MPTSKRQTQRKISSFATVLDGGNKNKRKRGEVGFGVAKARVSPSAVGSRSLVRSRHDATMYYALKQFWGYDSFRFQQQQIIAQALQGKDCFVIMPTGGGKSLCYQLPAIVTRGVTIVVTPLVSLMQNQVSSLINCKGGGIPAFAFHSSITETQARAVYRELAKVHPTLKLVYVTPEKLVKSDTFMEIIGRLYEDGQLSRIVIDEAHCVSQWGHDFRPDYKKLGMLKTKFPNTPIMALTATATEKVRADVMKQLKMKQRTTALFKSSFDRPNLSWIVIAKDSKSKQKSLEQLLKICKEQYKAPQCGIIYCLSQKDTEEVSQYLTTNKVQASFYHAGNSAKDRTYVQQNWENGNIRIVVATIAFGMGIDKKDVRFVIHFCAPKSIDGYYQETGRAGRDGKPSDCLLLYSTKDIGRLRRLINMPKKGNTRQMKERGKAKISEIKDFCENNNVCRRSYLLRYYGQVDTVLCGEEGRDNRCDVCQQNGKGIIGTCRSSGTRNVNLTSETIKKMLKQNRTSEANVIDLS